MANRRSFLKKMSAGSIAALVTPVLQPQPESLSSSGEKKQGLLAGKGGRVYRGTHLNRIAFPLGGTGAGMFCIEGTGAISHMSVRNNPEMFFEPAMFAALSIKNMANGTRVLEGPVPLWKKFGQRDAGLGGTGGATWGLRRFRDAAFEVQFPFATISLVDDSLPLKATIKAWSPFIPGDEDQSGMPIVGLEYSFENTSKTAVEATFSYNSRNFMHQGEVVNAIQPIKNGFILSSSGSEKFPERQGDFAIFTDTSGTLVDHCWFRGGWFDGLTMIWNKLESGTASGSPAVEKDAPGASLFVPFSLKPGEKKVIKLFMCWYVPHTKLQFGEVDPQFKEQIEKDPLLQYHKPWYSSRFSNINEVADFWRSHYEELHQKTQLFTKAFYNSTLPAEVIDAVAANLTILKSPTVLRQHDGRLWTWEGCGDNWGSCHGSCTHVWNYAQAVPHLFPALERSLRETEFNENQNADGHQVFRANLPISPTTHNFHSAADGQLGGIMKVYRDWRISGDDQWMRNLYPKVKKSLDYCIKTWDPDRKGVIEEPHHNTYDIEFWGPTGFATTFYLGALNAIINIGKHLEEDVAAYEKLLKEGKSYLETKLFNGEYFVQDIQYEHLKAANPATAQSFGGAYSDEAIALLKKEGPKYQYEKGCLSDGVLGSWLAVMCGLEDVVDASKIASHLRSVHRYNLKKSLVDHSNPQRPGFALGSDGGLLLCTWPKDGKLSLPFVYSNEVWTGIEYQAASHLMTMGEVQKGLDIVRACRARYDGAVRNPFNEYECGHWYARALSSYGLLQGLTGVRYDAVTKTLTVDSKVGDFVSFIATATGFGNIVYKNKKAVVNVVQGQIAVDKFVVKNS
ncbi:GH116 family glycosyl hydrolase [Niabella sp. 22666]|uniref:GH116 family glycosyl hydrolase n=1 Tax=Niabella sp. 22666 TaxID=3453954 RepID=UPI003F861BCD